MDFLKVTINLGSPMVEPGDLFHLDALLGALRVSEVRAELGDGINPRDHHYDLPLEQYRSRSGQWVFKASAFHINKGTASQNWMQTSRINTAEAARHRSEGFLLLRAAKPNPAGGPFKNSLYHYPLVWATLTAYCVGDQARIADLLSQCRQIGGRRGVGCGRVAGFSVEVVPEVECTWALRAMPDDSEQSILCGEYALAMSALQSPYWDRSLHKPALVPTSLA
ncbi:hypothetical protein B382_19600 [Stutzerimonas stutzeri B1SMN1]|jgi:CRISPR type IV-associated protein Csf3|uniref:Uncharacterized protein n=1 Tax=Pseudomonas putida TaxID=303 RepID=A0A1L7NMF5_PSEPU|nr:hypothetical protein [Pseudomonas putida]ELQ8317487.1 hypothetical protein [Pseudomonas aeruginosa]EPL60781.1 hypothetical protein B382_19600 [Stutzerimonas stutzeri B1SMN1]BAW26656.1 Uncharacterized protein KF715C_pA1510 [Pseudomonas putida]HBO7922019.1 hypothetical protein [Pseudomonas aeruginosa]